MILKTIQVEEKVVSFIIYHKANVRTQEAIIVKVLCRTKFYDQAFDEVYTTGKDLLESVEKKGINLIFIDNPVGTVIEYYKKMNYKSTDGIYSE